MARVHVVRKLSPAKKNKTARLGIAITFSVHALVSHARRACGEDFVLAQDIKRIDARVVV